MSNLPLSRILAAERFLERATSAAVKLGADDATRQAGQDALALFAEIRHFACTQQDLINSAHGLQGAAPIAPVEARTIEERACRRLREACYPSML